jgi:hypothetical protein
MANSPGIDSSWTIRTTAGLLVDEQAWRLLRRNVERAKHTFIVGPTGVGKTRLAIEVGVECDRSVEVFHFGGVFDAEATITGTTSSGAVRPGSCGAGSSMRSRVPNA